MASKALFVFEFHFPDDTSRRCELPIRWIMPEDEDFVERLYDEIDVRRLETRFGIHDFNTNQTDDINIYEAIGYTSYEVDKNKVSALLKEWEQILTKLGIPIVGPWEIIDYVE